MTFNLCDDLTLFCNHKCTKYSVQNESNQLPHYLLLSMFLKHLHLPSLEFKEYNLCCHLMFTETNPKYIIH